MGGRAVVATHRLPEQQCASLIGGCDESGFFLPTAHDLGPPSELLIPRLYSEAIAMRIVGMPAPPIVDRENKSIWIGDTMEGFCLPLHGA